MKKPIAVDLFAGCGGLTEGLKQAGFRVVGAVEMDSLAVETYKVNHKRVNVWHEDIRKIVASNLLDELGLKKGQLDLLAGCPPCQGFSSMRTLNGSRVIDDPRNKLIYEFLRFIRVLRPKTVLMENVPGLRRDDSFDDFCVKLKSLGYSFSYHVHNAADYGVPQRRRRLILVAHSSKVIDKIDFATPLKKRRTVRDAIAFLPDAGNSGDQLHDYPEKRTPHVQELISKVPKDGGSRGDLSNDDLPHLVGPPLE